jgi:concentrative nucleoside transporter, CNT family
MFGIFQPILGAIVILGIGYVFSTNRRAINWTTVAWGLGLQIVFAFIVLKTSCPSRALAPRLCSDRWPTPGSGDAS